MSSLICRLIPCLLLKGNGLYKSTRFKDYVYIGDPINTVKLFNDKEADELVILDIEATDRAIGPNFSLISNIVSEAFMPVAYGGGIRNGDDARILFNIGVEKVIFNDALINNFDLVQDVIAFAGSSSVVASIDVKKSFFNNYTVYTKNGKHNSKLTPVELAKNLESLGVGEILLNSIDHDGLMAGFDLALIKEVAKNVNIPVIAIGGAGSMNDFKLAVQSGASAVAASSFFIFHGKHKAVLITYPHRSEIKRIMDT
jgi:cyclase